MRSLRARLLAAFVLAVVLSVGLTLAVGLKLTQREVERATLADLGRRADVLAERERASLLPLSRLKPVQQTLAGQDEELVAAPLAGPTQYLDASEQADLRQGRAVQGVRGGRYYAARPVAGRALVLLRPTKLDAAASRPFARGLLIAGLAGLLLAVAAAVLLARAIVRPVRRVAEAACSLAAERAPEPVPVEGPIELATLAESFNDMAAKLARARAAERDFLLSVSHELKTPLTAIRGYAEAAAEGALDPRDAAATISREARRLERLVRDLLDLARMNRSEFAVHREPIDLAAVAREAVRRYEQQARAFGIELATDANGGAPALADSDRTLQVVSNLVENALRVTPAGGRVVVAVEPGELCVEDTGPGLRPEELPRAFERFFLYSRYGAERKVGTGLGLAIVRHLTERMGGRVSVESEAGRTRFVVVLPSVDAQRSRA
jgi:two-component system sensor histidine kinase BaeS